MSTYRARSPALAERRVASTFIPKARERRATSRPILPNPTTPTDLPRNTEADTCSHRFCRFSSKHKGARFTIISINCITNSLIGTGVDAADVGQRYLTRHNLSSSQRSAPGRGQLHPLQFGARSTSARCPPNMISASASMASSFAFAAESPERSA